TLLRCPRAPLHLEACGRTAAATRALRWQTRSPLDSIPRMKRIFLAVLTVVFTTATFANDLPTRKYLDLAAVKIMVAGAEAEAKKQNVSVTIVIVDDSGNLLFLQKGDTA